MEPISMSVSYEAIAAGALLHFLVPALWYQPWATGKRWMRLLDKSPDYWAARQQPALVRRAMGSYAVASVVVAFCFFMLVKGGTMAFGQHGFVFAASTGVIIWLATLATDIGQYGFEGRPWALYPIDKLDRLVSWPLMCGVMAEIGGL